MLLSSQLRKHYKSHGIQLSRSELMEFSWRFIRSHQDSVFAMYFKKYEKKARSKNTPGGWFMWTLLAISPSPAPADH